MTEHKIIFGDSRSLNQIKDKSVQLIVTSPPYWQLKDYGTEDQIGFNDSYEEYINNLNLVWKECNRVLSDGCRLCINRAKCFLRNFQGRLHQNVKIPIGALSQYKLRSDLLPVCDMKKVSLHFS